MLTILDVKKEALKILCIIPIRKQKENHPTARSVLYSRNMWRCRSEFVAAVMYLQMQNRNRDRRVLTR